MVAPSQAAGTKGSSDAPEAAEHHKKCRSNGTTATHMSFRSQCNDFSFNTHPGRVLMTQGVGHWTFNVLPGQAGRRSEKQSPWYAMATAAVAMIARPYIRFCGILYDLG